MLGAIEKLLCQAFIPAISKVNVWSPEGVEVSSDITESNDEASATAENPVKQEFLGKLNSFASTLHTAQASLGMSVQLKFDFNKYDNLGKLTLEQYEDKAANIEEFSGLESAFSSWIASINQVHIITILLV